MGKGACASVRHFCESSPALSRLLRKIFVPSLVIAAAFPIGMGTVRFFLRKPFLTCAVLFLPTFLVAANSALLSVSNTEGPSANDALRSAALFVGDTVSTRPDSVASINAEGSMVLVLADSSVQFEGNSVNMGHGGVVVTTTRAMAVRAGRLTISPLAQRSAKFEVSDSDGVVQIAAREGALAIHEVLTPILQEGQEATREDSDQAGGHKATKGAAPGGNGFHMSKKTALITFGSAAAAGTTAALLLTTGNGSHPVSPAAP